MQSLSFFVAVITALALCVKGQDMNVTMAPDDNNNGMDMNVTMAPGQPDPDTTAAMMGNDTDNAMGMTTTMKMMMNDTTPDVQQPDDNDTMTTASSVTSEKQTMTTMMETTTEEMSTTTPSPCKVPTGRLQEVYEFTNTATFRDLQANTQILVYEVLAAAEGCKMTSFITPETAERIFRMLGELPVRHIYTLINYMASALQNEGVVGPS